MLLDTSAGFVSALGMLYPRVAGIPDFRRRISWKGGGGSLWQISQAHYEAWSDRLVDSDARQDYVAEIDGVREMYGNRDACQLKIGD